MTFNIVLILSSVLLNAFAQIFLKLGLKKMSGISLNNNIIETFISFAINPYILVGFISYGVSIVIWLRVLYEVDVSFAYPFQASGYIIVTFLAWIIFQEDISLIKLLALSFITLGLILLTFSVPNY